MKNLIAFFCLLLSVNILGQVNTLKTYKEFRDFPYNIISHIEQMGVDGSPLLNKHESDYFNFFFQDSRQEFDFSEKKIAYMQDRGIRDKKQYFEEERERFAKGYSTIGATLHVFDENQKIESGGYDAFILYWAKFSISKEDFIRRMKRSIKKKK